MASADTQGYHETITRFYVVIIQEFLRRVERKRSIDLLADEFIKLYGDKSLPFAYYSKDKLFSTAARREWLEPDLKTISRMERSSNTY